MSDSTVEMNNSNSKSNLIEVQHVGVTAKLQSPLKNLLPISSSSTETENGPLLYNQSQNRTKYNKFSNDTPTELTESTTDSSKVLYEMRTMRTLNKRTKVTPSKIEFQLYNKPGKRLRRHKQPATKQRQKQKQITSKFRKSDVKATGNETVTESSIFRRLRKSLDNMLLSRKTDSAIKTTSVIFEESVPKSGEKPTLGGDTNKRPPQPAASPGDIRIGIYPFEHGCADYLRTTDCPPQIFSVLLAERATQYATRFWAEIFGSLQIGVSFIVTFMLQCYRFLLYSLINTLLVGFLHMTSDYLIKPILTVTFNGFLQPPLIFIYNILTSIRDLLEPVADTINNFMKPVATVGRSFRLVHASYNNRKPTKTV